MARLRDDLFEIWYGQDVQRKAVSLNPFLFLLRILSILFGSALWVRRILFRIGLVRARELPCPVVSIGNISVGGTGKTPAVIALAALFRAKGYRPAILSRGYGGEGEKGPTPVSDGRQLLAGPDRAGDEPYLIATALPGIPVITGKDRYLSGNLAVRSFGADILFLDDAFQHWGLGRDVDIVLLNAAAPFGNGFLLPRGPLRERVQSLSRAHAIVLTGAEPEAADTAPNVKSLRNSIPGASVLTARYRLNELVRNGEAQKTEYLRGKRVLAFCGLANPGSFRDSLKQAGAQIVAFLSYPDHFRYTRKEIEDIEARAKASGAELIVSTEKDGVKLSAFPEFSRSVFRLRISLEFTPERALAELIENRIGKWKKPGQRPSLSRSSD